MAMRTNPYATALNVHRTAQSAPIPGREAEQVQNAAGGFGFAVDDWTRLERFLVLGSENGTYYATEKKHTIENAQALRRCVDSDPLRVVRTCIAISDAGRAYRNDPALFCLAATAAFALAPEARHAAYEALPRVARTGTHLLHFVAFRKSMGGTGMGLRKAIGRWYQHRSTDSLTRQLVKYQSRDGWSNRDLLRLAHVKPESDDKNFAMRWAVGKTPATDKPTPNNSLILGFEQAKRCTDKSELLSLIDAYGLEREMIPTEFLKDPDVWGALLPGMGFTAMLRNLGNMSKVGLLTPLSDAERSIVQRLEDNAALAAARIHPLQVLTSMMVYAAGRGAKGKGEWKPCPRIVDALDAAFVSSFKYVVPSGARFYLAVDCSGSMGGPDLMGILGLSPRVATACMAMAIARVESNYYIAGFTGSRTGYRSNNSVVMLDLGISARDRLDVVTRKVDRVDFGTTDCSMPMQDALAQRMPVDCFVVLTDNETWSGAIHPTQALAQYRREMQRPAKLVVVAMTASGTSIADPKDTGMMDVSGFDSAVPSVISDFAKGA